jgi:hypothetical protein
MDIYEKEGNKNKNISWDLFIFLGVVCTIVCSIVAYRNRNVLWPKHQHSAAE